MSTYANGFAKPGMRWKVKDARTRKTIGSFQNINTADEFQIQCSKDNISTVIRLEMK